MFNKVFQSRKVRGINNDRKIHKYDILIRASEAREENIWLKPKLVRYFRARTM